MVRHQDRRLHLRVPMQGLGARVTSREAQGGSRRVELVDISQDGVRWVDERPSSLTAGARVGLILPPPRVFSRALELEGIVVRRDRDACSMAARFVAGPARARLDHYVHRARARVGADMDRAVLADTPVASAFRLLGVSLHDERPTRSEIVMISSPRAAEGKSFVAGGVASALAAMDRRVLLVDADGRNPVQHVTFQVNREPGLVELLGNPSAPGRDAAFQRSANGVTVLTAGSPGTKLNLLSPYVVRQLADVLRTLEHSTVIIDAPPVLEAAETLLLARVADETLLTVRSGATRTRDVRQALAMLTRQGTPASGVILNDHEDALRSSQSYQAVARALVSGQPATRSPRSARMPTPASPVDSEMVV